MHPKMPWYVDEGSGLIIMASLDTWITAHYETPLFEASAQAHNERLCSIDGWMPF